jgi:radical SAM protein with 4Fe4S-binding SPASM domain
VFDKTSAPKHVILEVTSACNFICKGCAFHGPDKQTDRQVGHMKRETWEPVLDQIGSWGTPVNISAHGGGEPLLNPRFKEILLHAKQYDNIEVGFLSHGMLFDEEWAQFVIDNKIDWVAFSVDGVDPDTHLIVREKSDLDLIVKNIERFMDMKEAAGVSEPRIMLNMVAYQEIAYQQKAFVNRWAQRANGVMVSHYRHPPSSKRWPNIPKVRKPCNLLWNQLTISSDGRIALCCEDFNVDHSPGHVKDDTLENIWQGEYWTHVRGLHQSGDYDAHPMCAVCDTWADDTTTEHYDSEIHCHVIKSPSQKVYSYSPTNPLVNKAAEG